MAAITRSERGWSNRLIEEFMLTRERVRGALAGGAAA